MQQNNRITIPTITVLIVAVALLTIIIYGGRVQAAGITDSLSTLEDLEGPRAIYKVTSEHPMANCRYGTAAEPTQQSVVASVGAGAYYWFNNPYPWGSGPGNGAERLLMIRVKQEKTAEGEYLPEYTTEVPIDENLKNLILDNLGAFWMLGNEIERPPNPGQLTTSQGDIYPDIYAIAYHDIYHFIKGIDPSARIAIGGLIEPTPARLQYLDIVWDTYLQKYGTPMPMDVWNIHLYPFSEVNSRGEPNNLANIPLGTDPKLGKRSTNDPAECPDPDVYCRAEHDDISLIEEHVLAIRQWMKDHGQQQKPLIISEYSIVWPDAPDPEGEDPCKVMDEYGECFTIDRNIEFLNAGFDLFNDLRDPNLGYKMDNNRLVQQVIWFQVWSAPYHGSNLIAEKNDMSQLSRTGEAFRDYVDNEPVTRNLIVEEVSGTVIGLDDMGKPIARLLVKFRNNGNHQIAQPFDVTFYRDEALTQPIGSTRITSSVLGCTTRAYRADVTWEGLDPGVYQFWVKVDSSIEVEETQPGKSDNIGTVVFSADENPIFNLSVDVQGEGGESGGVVSLDPEGPAYASGQTVRLTAAAESGWRFSGWSGDASGTGESIEIVMDGNKTVTAAFERKLYTVGVKIEGQGTVEIAPEQESFHYNQWIQLNAVSPLGWRFAGWSGDINNGSSLLYLRATRDYNLVAKFAQTLPNATAATFLPMNASP